MIQNYSGIALSTALLPSEGPKMVPIPLDFSQQPSYSIDLQNLQERTAISSVQSIYVDNSQSGVRCVITFDGSQQSINAAGNTQGYYLVLATNPVRFTATSTGGALVRLYLLNVPVAGYVWSAL